ncbi:cytochrome-c oxidase, cbb3-type subunit III [Rheinheimera baltica]|uniref:Cbb3-type cytochrome c oxidase subunit n=1 Tax=Rheinheimera baltica TaxID=67576 RepID=A0ABT9HWS1_9GAMM|nr:cytochrome-c oxidase, cbb3-type subunit III [Rheinheimera baltica]MDP5135579.1 cytochrome-c oxidase, cbb3-type subunit III [Rheinheimera baltica]MDP5143355.1 cytochrome-c oxidase, cbb3-type subunit III [Rheinheimera baltica]MDP5151192.1 cytochrome-c oxidase, cbb3-type subunit III [Rheinheimera baltica]MDP5191186.1 cytochrome-c oxidase, cbb3-type subunit III [Rheinheimera baltica]
MSSFWSAWIIVLTLPVLIGCALLLRWNLKNYVGVAEDQNTGHVIDGIEEINNPLPRWWTYMFVLTLVWSVFYLAAYPGLGNWQGFLGWTSSNQGIKSLEESRLAVEENRADGKMVELDREMLRAEEVYGPVFQQFAKRDVLDLAYDDAAIKIGQRLFLQNCALCHGSDARGQHGFPNLTDNDWLYGGSPDKIKETLLYGRKAAMPGWFDAMGEQGIKEMTAYVLSLSGRTVNDRDAAAGKVKFALCAACHGADGKGSLAHNLPFGAPNLTDNIWLYGSSAGAVTETLTKGRNGQMPAFKQTLGEDKVHILTAYVYRLANPDKAEQQ